MVLAQAFVRALRSFARFMFEHARDVSSTTAFSEAFTKRDREFDLLLHLPVVWFYSYVRVAN